MGKTDTIVAISTPAGIGGVALLRISGAEALSMTLPFLSTKTLKPRHSTFTRFITNGNLIDEILVVLYPAPHSYTGEDMIEISCHGSLYIQQTLLDSYIQSGARLAEAGEFTRRAFLNGKLNLSQAEAVADLIDSVTPAAHRLAISQLRGGYAQQLQVLRQQLLDLTSLLELELDFSQEDVEFADRSQLLQLLTTLDTQLTTLISTFRMGNALKQGIPTAILGRPNAGKSSLLNALLNDNRAIVSPVPGTTRDTIEELLTIDGITFRFIDTAGLRATDDDIESQGIDRSYKALQQADIILYVHDATHPFETQELANLNLTGKQLLLIFNKTDLAEQFPNPLPSNAIPISCTSGEGLDLLKQALTGIVVRKLPSEGNILLSNARHHEALVKVQQALKHASEELMEGIPADLVAVDLRDALYHLGAITGEVTSPDILTNIFSRFCIGK